MAETAHRRISVALEPPVGAKPAADALDLSTGKAQRAQQDLVVECFDTLDGSLARLGIVLQRDHGGPADGWHVRLPQPDGLGSVDVTAAGRRIPKNPPQDLRDAVDGLVRGRALTRVATLHIHRRVTELLDHDSAVVAEVWDDSIAAESASSGKHLSWRQWGIVMHDPEAGISESAIEHLRSAGARERPHSAGLARILGVPAEPETARPDPERHEAAWLAVHRRLEHLVTAVNLLDPWVRLDLPDSVHDMRVALRRLRSTLATFRPIFDRDVTDPLRDEVRWIARLLGDARDSEVLRTHLLDRLDGVSDHLVLGPVADRVRHELDTRYREALAESVAGMRSDRYHALLDRLDALVATPPWTDAAYDEADQRLRGRVAHDWKRVRRSANEISADPRRRDEQLHNVRKAAKRVRYAAETLQPLYGRDAARFAAANKKVQSLLGDHNDSVVARRELLTLAQQAEQEGEPSFTYGLLYALEQSEAAALRERFGRRWRKASRGKLRRWLH